jgi:adenylyltransferase and sulfurtransferase
MHDRLVMYDSLRCSFLSIKKPPKQPKCPVCSEGSFATIHSMEDSYNLSQSARGPTNCPLKQKREEVNDAEESSLSKIPKSPTIPDFLAISCMEYDTQIRKAGGDHVLLDVRAKEQFDLCSLKGAVNIPLADLSNQLQRVKELSNGTKPVYCICRRGIFSTTATLLLQQTVVATGPSELGDNNTAQPGLPAVYNIVGGLESWRDQVDPMFPKY